MIPPEEDTDTFADTTAVSSDSSSGGKKKKTTQEPEEEIYQEGRQTVIEDKEGNVLGVRDSHGERGDLRLRHDGERAAQLMAEKDVHHGVARKEHGGPAEETPGKIESAIEHPQKTWRQRMHTYKGRGHQTGEAAEPPTAPKSGEKTGHKSGPALAYQFGNTIIVEDQDGEVLKKYDIPATPKKGKEGRPETQRGQSMVDTSSRAIQSLKRMGTHMGVSTHTEAGPSGTQSGENKKQMAAAKEQEDDEKLRFTVTAGGRRMSKAEFIQQMAQMNPKERAKFVQSSNVPEAVKDAAAQDAQEHKAMQRRQAASAQANVPSVVGEEGEAEIHKIPSPAADSEGRSRGPEGLTLVDSNDRDIPFHTEQGGEAVARGRPSQRSRDDATRTDFDGETPAERNRRVAALGSSPAGKQQSPEGESFSGETAAERKRRLGALGVGGDNTPESDSEDEETGDPLETGRGTHHRPGELKQTMSPTPRTPGIRFADQPRMPTKDERAAEDTKEKDDREKESKKKSGLSKFIGRK
jgi:hypothetical protein